MAGELIYSNVIFNETANKDNISKVKEREEDVTYSEVRTGANLQVNAGKVKEREEDVTYSEVRTGANQQVNAGKDNNTSSGDPSPPVESKVVTPERASQRVALVTLVSVCVVLLVMTITLGYFYASNKIDFQDEKVRSEDLFAQMRDNLTGQKDLLSSDLQNYKINLTEVNKLLANATDTEDLLSSNLQNCTKNLTEVNKLLANATAMKDHLFSELQNYKRNLTEVNQLLADATAKQCAIGWVFYNGSCYYISQDKLTWEDSQYACIHDGGHLVIIESQQEQDFLRRKVANNEYWNGYWIGMTDIKVEGTWVWMDNTILNSNIKYWDLNNGTFEGARPEPNDWAPGEDCAQIDNNPSSGDPSPPVESKVVTLETGSVRAALVTLIRPT